MSIIKDTNVYVTLANTGEFDVRYNNTKTPEQNSLTAMKNSAVRHAITDPKGPNHLFTWVASNLTNNLEQYEVEVINGDFDGTKDRAIAAMVEQGYKHRKAK